MAIGSSTSRQVGKLCRIYKNSGNKVIAIDDIAIVADTQRIHKLGVFHQSAIPVHQRTLFYLESSNRVVDKILIFGDFSSISIDGGNYQTGTWENEGETNNLIIIIFYKHKT